MEESSCCMLETWGTDFSKILSKNTATEYYQIDEDKFPELNHVGLSDIQHLCENDTFEKWDSVVRKKMAKYNAFQTFKGYFVILQSLSSKPANWRAIAKAKRQKEHNERRKTLPQINVFTELSGFCEYYEYASEYRAAPHDSCQTMEISINLFSERHIDYALEIIQGMLNDTCPDLNVNASAVKRTAAINFDISITPCWEVISRLDGRILMDQHGYWYAKNMTQYMSMITFCGKFKGMTCMEQNEKSRGFSFYPLYIKQHTLQLFRDLVPMTMPSRFRLRKSRKDGERRRASSSSSSSK